MMMQVIKFQMDEMLLHDSIKTELFPAAKGLYVPSRPEDE